MKDGGGIFPVLDKMDYGSHFVYKTIGITLRDYFAGQALTGLLADTRRDAAPEDFARIVYRLADAMLAEREKSK